jgi:hypothetical protein
MAAFACDARDGVDQVPLRLAPVTADPCMATARSRPSSRQDLGRAIAHRNRSGPPVSLDTIRAHRIVVRRHPKRLEDDAEPTLPRIELVFAAFGRRSPRREIARISRRRRADPTPKWDDTKRAGSSFAARRLWPMSNEAADEEPVCDRHSLSGPGH